MTTRTTRLHDGPGLDSARVPLCREILSDGLLSHHVCLVHTYDIMIHRDWLTVRY